MGLLAKLEQLVFAGRSSVSWGVHPQEPTTFECLPELVHDAARLSAAAPRSR